MSSQPSSFSLDSLSITACIVGEARGTEQYEVEGFELMPSHIGLVPRLWLRASRCVNSRARSCRDGSEEEDALKEVGGSETI